MKDGQFICLRNEKIEVLLTAIGASVRSLFVKDRNGRWRDIVLGYESEEDYLTNPASLGAVVGRYAGRVSGAGFKLSGKTYELDKNEGENCLHSGFDRYETRRFRVSSQTEKSVSFELESPDGDQGFPGNALIRVTYSLTDDAGLRIEYYAKSDTETVFNLTNHSYFQLNGHDAGDISGHTIRMDADEYIELDKDAIPTGRIHPVDDSKFDLRTPRQLSESYDDCLVLKSGRAKDSSAQRSGDESGIQMDVYTDRPAIVLYTAEYLDEDRGKGGARYSKRCAVCLECEGYPNAMNRPEFPSEIYDSERAFKSMTELHFHA